jgi:SAGA-associated factor 29
MTRLVVLYSLASEALESLGIIMALRAPEQLQGKALSFPCVVLWKRLTYHNFALTVPVDTNKRKKRRLDASPAPSDVSSARASPAPQGGPPTPSLEKVSRSLSRSLSINTTGQGTSSPGPEFTPSTATTIAPTPGTARSIGKQQQQQQQQPAQLTRKERKEAIVAQLPLKEGRPVAFKPPAKALGKGAKLDPGSLDYILTRVVRCIAGDKNRYEVQDVQDENEVDGKPGA